MCVNDSHKKQTSLDNTRVDRHAALKLYQLSQMDPLDVLPLVHQTEHRDGRSV